ncbi:hypothetical protein QQ045_015304 [Rhodiola kirilowii]
MERLRHKSRQTLKVPVEGSGERQRVNSNSLSHVSLVSNTPHEDGGAIVAENKEISPIVEGDSSSVLEISESIEESKDSIESEAPFIEVKRKMKKNEKKRNEKKRKNGREEKPKSRLI